jgi:serine/threonine-protein kinase
MPHASLGLCAGCLLTSVLSTTSAAPRYEPLSVIAEDDGAITYLAQSRPAGPPGLVALKVLSASVDGDRVLARFEHWKPILTSLRHQGLAPIADAGVTDAGAVYLASRFVTGSPIALIGSRAGTGVGERMAIARQLIDAIETAHDAGLVHLKIHPASVKVEMTGHLRVTILGLGSSLVLDDVRGDRGNDLEALAGVIAALGIEVRGHQFLDAAALRSAIPALER